MSWNAATAAGNKACRTKKQMPPQPTFTRANQQHTQEQALVRPCCMRTCLAGWRQKPQLQTGTATSMRNMHAKAGVTTLPPTACHAWPPCGAAQQP